MGHISAVATAAVHACSGAGSTTVTGSTSGGAGGGFGPSLDLPLLAGVFAALVLLGAVSAAVTFILARRLPPPAPAPIPVWNYPDR